MPADVVTVFENFLQLAGAFIVFSLARIAYRGLRETRSATLLRLSLAFTLLGIGFALSGVSGLVELRLLPSLVLSVSLFFIAAAAFEVLGYFFLAFSHAIDVVAGARLLVLPGVVALNTLSPTAVLKSASVLLLLYGVIETTWSSLENKRKGTLIIATGFSLITIGEFISWVNLIVPTQSIYVATSLLVKILGFISLYIPVIRFSFRGST